MSPRQAHAMIRAAIRRRPELRYKSPGAREQLAVIIAAREQWQQDQTCPYRGFCYIATQAFCYLIPDAVPWCTETRSHFWATWPHADGEIWDLTAEQFSAAELERIYARGRPTHFKTLSGRARELLEEAHRGLRTAAA